MKNIMPNFKLSIMLKTFLMGHNLKKYIYKDEREKEKSIDR